MNIFHAYRGQTRGAHGADEVAKTRELENNLTRALAITLSRLGPCEARSRLLETLGVPADLVTGFRRCLLQVSKPEPRWAALPTRRFVAIVGALPPDAVIAGTRGASEPQGLGIPDLVVEGDAFLIVVESKLGDTVTPEQWVRHAKALGIPWVGDFQTRAWSELAGAAKLTHPAETPVSWFVLVQFEEYLRMNGFGGFTIDHFNYFALGPEEREQSADTKDGIRRQLANMIQALKTELKSDWPIQQGKILKEHAGAYAALKPSLTKVSSGQPPHLSVGIDAEGIEIFFNIETERAHRRFLRAFHDDSDGFLNKFTALANGDDAGKLKDPWRLNALYRVPTGQLRQCRVEMALDIAALAAKALDAVILRGLINTLVQKPVGGWSPEIKVVRRYHAADVIGNKGFTAQVVQDAKRLAPLFDWMDLPLSGGGVNASD